MFHFHLIVLYCIALECKQWIHRWVLSLLLAWLIDVMSSMLGPTRMILWTFWCMRNLRRFGRKISITFHRSTTYQFRIDVWRLLEMGIKLNETRNYSIEYARKFTCDSRAEYLPSNQWHLPNPKLWQAFVMVAYVEPLAFHRLSLKNKKRKKKLNFNFHSEAKQEKVCNSMEYFGFFDWFSPLISNTLQFGKKKFGCTCGLSASNQLWFIIFNCSNKIIQKKSKIKNKK